MSSYPIYDKIVEEIGELVNEMFVGKGPSVDMRLYQQRWSEIICRYSYTESGLKRMIRRRLAELRQNGEQGRRIELELYRADESSIITEYKYPQIVDNPQLRCKLKAERSTFYPAHAALLWYTLCTEHPSTRRP